MKEEWFRKDLKAKGLLEQYPEIYQAVGRQAILLYKEEIELLLRTPGYGGFSLLDLHDYPTQGTALIGPLDPFWESKGFITPEKHRQYCNTVVPLLRIPKRAYTLDEAVTGTVELANYGQKDLTDVQPQWSVRDEAGHEVASGLLPVTTAPTGMLSPLGSITASLAKAKAPCKLTVEVSLKGTAFANEWEIWVYPTALQSHAPADVVISRTWDDAAKALAAGKVPVPAAIELPSNFKPTPAQASSNRRFGFPEGWGCEIGTVNGLRPLYITRFPKGWLHGEPLAVGDVILAVDGEPLVADPIGTLGKIFDAARGKTAKLSVTRWRAGSITRVMVNSIQEAPDFTQGDNHDEWHDWTLGPTGLRGWIYGSKCQTSESR